MKQVEAKFHKFPFAIAFISGGLHAVDVSDPLNPTFAGCFGDDGYVHDAQCTIYTGPDTEHQDKEVSRIVISTIGMLDL